MLLNLPVLDQLSSCRNLLIAGMGGGYDLFCGLPIYFALRERGQTAHLANLRFAPIHVLKRGTRLTETLVGVAPHDRCWLPDFPEWHLVRWFHERRAEQITVWCFAKTGARPLREGYRILVEHLSVDGILLIDGGVDSLMHGNEPEPGTFIEDTLSLHAVSQLDQLSVRLLGCVGMGAERGLSHAHALENLAALADAGGFLGSCSLVREMAAFQAYEDAVTYVHGQPLQDPSVINASIVSAVRGHFGDFHLTEKTRDSRLWISPLMPIYWFFNLEAVADRNLLLSQLGETDMFREAALRTFELRQLLPSRAPARIMLP
jgi:hypothetical protein